jgi:hypothetical protein
LTFKASGTFWKRFYDLPADQKESARKKWEVFKQDPFDPSLGTHKINRLSALLGKTVYGVEIEADLRVTFYRTGDQINTITIGTHEIYK